jgi:hypothetical protein
MVIGRSDTGKLAERFTAVKHRKKTPENSAQGGAGGRV